MDRINRTHRILLFCCLGLMAAGLCPYQSQAGQAAKEIPLPARVALAKAGGLIDQKAYGRAIEFLTEFQARGGPIPELGRPDPKGYHHAQVYAALGTCYLLQSQYEEASRAFELALQQDPGLIPAWLNLAKVCYERKNYSRAAVCFTKAYENALDKQAGHLYFAAAAHLMAQENLKSIASFEKLFKNHPQEIQPAWRENYVYALINADRARQALPHIRHLAETYEGEKQRQWQEILLHQYVHLEMRVQARAYAQLLTQQAPTHAPWWKALAHVHLRDGEHSAALTALTIYSYLEPLSDPETQLLADLHLQLGIPIKAAPLYEAALGKKYDARLLHHLALTLRQLGKPEQALAAIERLASDTRDAELLMLKADLQYSLGQYQQAAQTYQQTAKTATRLKGRAWLMAGYAALRAEDFETGRRAFEQAAAYDQHRKAARLAMQQLSKTKQSPSGRQPSM